MAAENPAVWNDSDKMQQLNQERSFLEKSIQEWERFHSRIEDGQVLLGMSVEEKDESSFLELKSEVKVLESLYESLELKRILNGELDSQSTYLSINSGAGGTESCDWASMLMRMYVRYAEGQGFGVEVLERTDGDEAGIKSVTLRIQGAYAYGYLKAEIGVHRLVRISPFDSNARRHTSFASVFAWAEVDDSVEVEEIKAEDLRVDTYRASGAGGQHVNRTDSAVRMTHLPTGIVVQCQSERSQIQNRERTMKMLKAALYEKEIERRNKEKDEANSQKKANEWGSQIRSYVMHPYKMVKDHRTSYETSGVDGVLDGELQEFMTEFLKMTALSEQGEKGGGE